VDEEAIVEEFKSFLDHVTPEEFIEAEAGVDEEAEAEED
jgi:hypothetical protein